MLSAKTTLDTCGPLIPDEDQTSAAVDAASVSCVTAVSGPAQTAWGTPEARVRTGRARRRLSRRLHGASGTQTARAEEPHVGSGVGGQQNVPTGGHEPIPPAATAG
jgi:hypothetical protein